MNKKTRYAKRFLRSIGKSFEVLEHRRMLATLVVDLDTDAQNPVGDGHLTLREAVIYANGGFVPIEDRPAFDFVNLGANNRIEINVDTVTLTDGLQLTKPVTVTSHASRDAVVRLSTSATPTTNKAFLIEPTMSDGLGDFYAASTFVIEDLTIRGFRIGVEVSNAGPTSGASPESVRIQNNRIEVVTGSVSAVGIYVGSDAIPFKILGNVVLGDGINTANSVGEVGIQVGNSTGTQTTVDRLHASLIEDNEIADIETGILVTNARMPNLQILGGTIGSIPSDPSWTGDSVHTGIRLTGVTNTNVANNQRLVGRIETDIRSESSGINLDYARDVVIAESYVTSVSGSPIYGRNSSGVSVRDSVLISRSASDISVADFAGSSSQLLNWSGNTYVTNGVSKPISHAGAPAGVIGPNSATYLGTAWEALVAFNTSQTGVYKIDFYAKSLQPNSETLYRYVETRTRSLTAGGQLSETMQFAQGAAGWNPGESLHAIVTAPDGSSSELAPVTGVLSDGSPSAGSVYIVSTTADDFDGVYSYGDFSLREAVNLVNTATGPVTILVREGHYTLSRSSGTDTGVSVNDLDVTGLITVLGDGAGKTIIDNAGLTGVERRAFQISSGGVLNLSKVTVANSGSGSAYQGLWVTTGGELNVIESALVNHQASAIEGSAIHADGGLVTIRRSVVTNNETDPYYTAAVYAKGGATLKIGESIFAANWSYSQRYGTWYRRNVQVDSSVTKLNEGYNLYDDASGGFFTSLATGDHLGTPNYVVTSVADTFETSDNHYALSIREAVHQANTVSGAEVIWLPAWAFELTRDRATYGVGSNVFDTDVAFGDIDIKDQLVIRGVAERTQVSWSQKATLRYGRIDAIFDLLGDYNGDDLVHAADFNTWDFQNNSGSQAPANWEAFSADGDDDGDVDQADYTVWSTYYGSSLNLWNVDEL